MSRTVTINEKTYTIDRLPLDKSKHIYRRFTAALLSAPEVKSAEQIDGVNVSEMFKTVVALGRMTDEEYDYFCYGLLAGVKRKESDNLFVKLVEGNSLRYQDIDMAVFNQLVFTSFEENFADFLASAQQALAVPS